MRDEHEDRINLIRDHLFAATSGLAAYQSPKAPGGATDLDPVVERLEDAIVEFERLVDSLFAEA